MSNTSLDDPDIITGHPSIEINGDPSFDLFQDIISIRFSDNLTRIELLEVVVNNWGTINGGIGFKYNGGTQGDDLVKIGTSIKLYCDTITLAVGTVATLAPSFCTGGPPTLLFSVDANRPHRSVHPGVFTVSYGMGLREFHPGLHKTLVSGRSRIQATGITAGSPHLRAGVKLDISGVGRIFTGIYSVTESTHTFDDKSGYRTNFACVKLITRPT
jgi:hypothetical protein